MLSLNIHGKNKAFFFQSFHVMHPSITPLDKHRFLLYIMSNRIGILTISDSATADPTVDKSGKYIAERFTELGNSTIKISAIVPDDKDAISDFITTWTHTNDVDLIISTGGTGYSPRDITPDVISPLLQRQAPGFVHAILGSSPKAVLSRPVAGIRGNTLIITLPGSLRAVSECLDAILANDLLNHALKLLKGENSRKLHSLPNEGFDISAHSHRQTEGGQTHEHHHHHHHHHEHAGHTIPKPRTVGDLDERSKQGAISQRPRKSLYPIITLEEAYNLIFSNLSTLPVEMHKVDASLRGHVLAERVLSNHDIPRSPSSNVDGYAVKSSLAAGTYKVVHSLNHSIREPVPDGYIYRINTGAPLPVGADAVIMVEDTQLHSEVEPEQEKEGDAREEKEVTTLAQVDPGENVRQRGSDVQEGAVVLDKGDVIGNTGGDIGALAFVGRRLVSVYRKPVVAILSTGNELLDLDEGTGRDDSWTGWDTNRPTLKGVLESRGYTVVDLGIIQDSMDAHEAALKEGFLKADVVITTGGSSMGTTDLLKPVIEQRLHGEILFGRVKVKPGKPTIFAEIPCDNPPFKPLFGLPGNPASALVTFYLFVLPALRILGGYPKDKCRLPHVKARLGDRMPLDPRPEYHRAYVWPDLKDGVLTARSTGGQRSSRAISLSGANALIALPSRDGKETRALEPGDMVEAILIDF